MKFITKEEMELLIKNGYLSNSRKGIVDRCGNNVGYYRTRNKRYIEDRYADIAAKLS